MVTELGLFQEEVVSFEAPQVLSDLSTNGDLAPIVVDLEQSLLSPSDSQPVAMVVDVPNLVGQGRFIPDWSDTTYRQHVHDGFKASGKIPEFIVDPESLLIQARSLNLLSHLTPDQRGVIQRRYEEGKTQRAISQELGKTEKMVSKIERNGLRHLDMYIKKRLLIDRAKEQGIFGRLQPAWQEVINYRYYYGRSTRQTAVETSRKPNTVSSMEIKALNLLRELIREQDASSL